MLGRSNTNKRARLATWRETCRGYISGNKPLLFSGPSIWRCGGRGRHKKGI